MVSARALLCLLVLGCSAPTSEVQNQPPTDAPLIDAPGGACPEAARIACSTVTDACVDPGGGGASELPGCRTLIAERLHADDAVTRCALPAPCWTCPRNTHVWRTVDIEALTRAYIAAGNRCP